MGTAPNEFDLAIVGGGVIGLSIAFEVAGRGASVALLERDRCGAGASTVAAGMLAPASEALREDPRLVRFGIESRELWPAFVRRVEEASGVSCDYREEGALWVALHRDHRADLERLAEVQRELGLQTAWLTPAEVSEREPRISGRIVAGLHVPGESRVDTRALVTALREAVARRGVTILERHEVDAVESGPRGLTVAGTRGGADAGAGGEASGERFRVAAHRAVLAAGAWMPSIGGASRPVPVRPVKGQIVRLVGESPLRGLTLSPDVYLVPRGDGSLVVGGTIEEQGFDAGATVEGVHELLRRAREVVPAVDAMTIASLDVSFRPAVRDHLPVIGPTGVPGLFVATAHYRNGILLAPATADAIAALLAGGDVTAGLEAFTMERPAAR